MRKAFPSLNYNRIFTENRRVTSVLSQEIDRVGKFAGYPNMIYQNRFGCLRQKRKSGTCKGARRIGIDRTVKAENPYDQKRSPGKADRSSYDID